MTRCDFSAWTIDAGVEPTIRVGVALPEDGLERTTVEIPDAPYGLTVGAAAFEPIRAAQAEVAVEGAGVVLRLGARTLGPAETIVFEPDGAETVAPGSGVRVKNVLTGRGFHWQKRFHPTLSGCVEFRAHGGRLLVVNALPLEQYLPGVLTGEMSGECPPEFLKSQCVVARAWVLAHTENKHPELPIDRCNDDCCQRYHGTAHLMPAAVEAANATRGQVIVDADNRIIDANYSKSCGGIIEAPEAVWGISKSGQRAAVDAPAESALHQFFPITDANLDAYLTGDWLGQTDAFCSPAVVPDEDLPRYLGKVDEGGGHFRWTVEYERAELEALLRRKHFERADVAAPPLATLVDLRVLRRGASGRVATLAVDYRDPDGASHTATIESEYAIRNALYEKFLYSSAFRLRIERGADGLPVRITLLGAGWGHGAGLCQIGALGMALRGYDCEAILKHYFEGVRLHACY
ncbi:MAG: SpoIID/LytB domain-containing protein [Phycisphaerae bacterium]|nr:SpoIID/LytB domain-containing protein [Phycisphaerae bacterium]